MSGEVIQYQYSICSGGHDHKLGSDVWRADIKRIFFLVDATPCLNGRMMSLASGVARRPRRKGGGDGGRKRGNKEKLLMICV